MDWRLENHSKKEAWLGEIDYAKYLFTDIYANKEAITEMVDISNSLGKQEQYVITVIVNGREVFDKENFLFKYYKNIDVKNCYFVSSSVLKVKTINSICAHRNINLKDVVLVDDKHETLESATQNGIAAIHPSVLLKCKQKDL